MLTPFYDPEKSYEENFTQGPFGIFVDKKIVQSQTLHKYDFLGFSVNSPFGIPAGPLINSNFCQSAFDQSFDICVYKTVRSGEYPCHPWPNILAVKIDGDLTLEKAQGKLLADDEYTEPISITNSFGVPSREPSIWQADVRRALSFARDGQILVLGFMGTVRENQTAEEFIANYALVAKQAKETGAKVLEMNLSCPNIGNEGLVCYNLDMTENVCRAVREAIGDMPLILKVGYYKEDSDIAKLAEIAEKYAQGIAAINTISVEAVDKNGQQALPGKNRLRSGVCGASIKWAGLEMVKKLKKLREELNYSYTIIGVGGVMKADDFLEYRSTGADIVMSATGAMWNPHLAKEIKERLV
jgi:dihydroorotate dehydrogenase (NAD+) catalytic subunit